MLAFIHMIHPIRIGQESMRVYLFCLFVIVGVTFTSSHASSYRKHIDMKAWMDAPRLFGEVAPPKC